MDSTSKRLRVRHEANALALAHGALHDAHQHDDAAIGIEPGVEDERLQRGVGVAGWRRQTVDDGLKHFRHALAGLGAHRDGVGGVESDGLLNGFLGAHDVRRGQIDFVDDGNDLKAVIDGQVSVGQRLSLDALACVHHQQRAFAGSQGARDFVAEVHVAGRVDEVELVGIAVVGLVHHAHGMGLDGDAALALQVHVVENLGLHLTAGYGACELQQTVAQRRLSVVDVCDDREVAKEACVHGGLAKGSNRAVGRALPLWHSLSSAKGQAAYRRGRHRGQGICNHSCAKSLNRFRFSGLTLLALALAGCVPSQPVANRQGDNPQATAPALPRRRLKPPLPLCRRPRAKSRGSAC
jgi:hypothetical protein